MKITFTNILISLAPMIVTNMLGTVLIYFMFNDLKLVIFIGCVSLFLFSMLPTIYLLISYLRNNKNICVSFNTDDIVILSKKKKDIILVSNIKEITFNGSKNIFEKHNIRFSTYDNFYYVKINMKDGEKFILTNLLSNNLREVILNNYPDVKITYNYRLVPYID